MPPTYFSRSAPAFLIKNKKELLVYFSAFPIVVKNTCFLIRYIQTKMTYIISRVHFIHNIILYNSWVGVEHVSMSYMNYYVRAYHNYTLKKLNFE